MKHIAVIGEVMIELSPLTSLSDPDHEIKALSFAGDTYNTAIYLARLGAPVDYVTILGDDSYSDQIIARMRRESLGSGMTCRLANRVPGLYLIRNSSDGEREFIYWRDQAPAKELFSDTRLSEQLYTQLRSCDVIYLSGITLAIISPQARNHLLYYIKALKANGATIAFDGNYRPKLWRSQEEAQTTIAAMMKQVDIALMTLDDERLLWGNASLKDCQRRYAQVPELVFKRGSQSTVLICKGYRKDISVPRVNNVVDTTGAGDTFNAGYLSARFQDKTPDEAAQFGTRCAQVVIQHQGAVIDRAVFREQITKE